MPTPIHTPRINNNDDTVRLAAVLVRIGSHLRAGDPVADVETDKATFTVEASTEGYLLGVNGAPGDTLQVGSVLAWIGATADEPIEAPPDAPAAGSSGDAPTLKALLLLKAHGLAAADVPHSGRLTAADVERHAAGRVVPPHPAKWIAPDTPGSLEPFTAEQKSMARTVTWHRDEAAAGYIEIAYDPQPWETYAAEFQRSHGLLLNPLLPLMACRLAKLAAEKPRLNAVATSAGAYLYERVNLGFTVQAGSNLYLVVLRDAAARSEADFVRELGDLQRSALKHVLLPEQTAGATVGFTSMARWNVLRHIPILAPQTGLMVAHSATAAGAAQLGASYDHRLLTGFDVAQALQALSLPAVVN